MLETWAKNWTDKHCPKETLVFSVEFIKEPFIEMGFENQNRFLSTFKIVLKTCAKGKLVLLLLMTNE